MFIPWELTADGKPARLKDRRVSMSPHTRGIMLDKIADLALVSATFGGIPVSFEPYLRVLSSNGRQATGFTLLLREYPADVPSETTGPNVCVRFCRWEGALAIQEFQDATNKREYVFSSPSLACTIRFFRGLDEPINRLMRRTTDSLSKGVGCEPCDGGEGAPDELDFFFCDGFQTCQFSYSPKSHRSIRLEELCRLWNDYLRSLDGERGEIPDDRCVVDYRDSIWERIDSYDAGRTGEGA